MGKKADKALNEYPEDPISTQNSRSRKKYSSKSARFSELSEVAITSGK